MDRRVDVRHFVHRRSCDISSSNMAAYERWPRVCGRGTKYITEVCRMHSNQEQLLSSTEVTLVLLIVLTLYTRGRASKVSDRVCIKGPLVSDP